MPMWLGMPRAARVIRGELVEEIIKTYEKDPC